jgi:very-short-patch-repair endonuclease
MPKKESILGHANPILTKEWEYKLNQGLTPYNITSGSGKRVWWICKSGHRWKASVANRSKGTGCPYCAGKRVLMENSFGALAPNLVKEWHTSKNKNLTPYCVPPKSNRKVWWICNIGHEWNTSVSARFGSGSKKGTNCPYCSGNKLVEEKSLARTHPELCVEWNISKNKMTPNEISYGSTIKVWWICAKGHEWKASCNNRTRGRNCPFCTRKKIKKEDSIAILYPQLLKEWDFTRNGEISPYQLSYGSERCVWWKCENGHEWAARINKRTKGQGCPKCRLYHGTSFNEQAIFYYIEKVFNQVHNRKVIKKGEVSFETDIYIPSINVAIEYDGPYHSKMKQQVRDVAKNIFLKAKDIRLIRVRSRGLPKIDEDGAFYIFEEKHQDIEASILRIFSYISVLPGIRNDVNVQNMINNVDVNVKRDSIYIYEKYLKYKDEKNLSKVFPYLSREWHPTKNEDLKLNQFTEGSNINVWWICNKGHSWKATINRRTSGSGCPYCSGKYVTFEKSLGYINPSLAKEWHPYKNYHLSPTGLAANSNSVVWWMCEDNHEWKASVNNRNGSNKGCPFCYGLYPTETNNLAVVNPKLSLQWHPTKNGNKTPKDFKSNSGKRVWWLCEEGHEWEAIIQSRNRGSGCKRCYMNRRKNN